MNRFKVTLSTTILFVILLSNNIDAQSESSNGNETKFIDSIDSYTLFINSADSVAKLDRTNYSAIQYDTSNLNVRVIDSSKIKNYLKDKDFSYFEDPESTMTLWERLMAWIGRQFTQLTDYRAYGTAWDIFMYILITFAVIAVVLGIYKSDVRGLFFSNKNKIGLNASESLEDIHSIDYENMIEEAITNRNYRYALRLNYLRTLKILSDQEIILWKIDKTNREFIREIKQQKLRSEFDYITSNFESIWYGGFEINQSLYSQLQLKFSDFNSSLGNNRL